MQEITFFWIKMSDQHMDLELNSKAKNIINKIILTFLVVGVVFLLFSLLFMQLGYSELAKQTKVVGVGLIVLGIIVKYFPFFLQFLEDSLIE